MLLVEAGERVDVVVPTGMAPLGVDGTTTHSWPATTDVLITNEISMVPNFDLERPNAIMQGAKDSKKPFGGFQLVVTGNFYQLPLAEAFANCLQ
ncbi:hypothetical protein F5Y15DRAFT_410363 [Xylariaceae sp. FL0016]|nr:hypothetical protein F5Y15DRAFT_410363 [Xylariaceae sp. FL0016]